MSTRRIPGRFRAGERLSPAKLNAMLDLIREVGDDTITATGPDGIGAKASSLGGIVEGPFIAKIVAPVGAETVYTDERYWITSAHCSLAAGDHETDMTFSLHGAAILATYIHVTATNLAEYGAAPPTHLIAVDRYVEVFRLFDAQVPGVPHYVFDAATPAAEGVTSIDIDGDTRSGDLGVDERNGPLTAEWRGAEGVDDYIQIGWEPNADVNMHDQLIVGVADGMGAGGNTAATVRYVNSKNHLPAGVEDDLTVCTAPNTWGTLTGWTDPGELPVFMGGLHWAIGGGIAAGSTDNLRVLTWDEAAGTIAFDDFP